ncbi:transmembrane amino acid transporter [Colletotrichum graminicola]|uniref:Transmembrane amino acid transporter n=1 Tax=Colletotrichum graminicola (strain M1.001 / M2 / FGSC 10212) TaxID=645133 RepID=E3Q9E8_COLGM|nr:transmembrane amino acid transporter [Colletotrichum graminicola M1.001]EFQ27327.1 transmembrane amino acid transporter [Colletotrichum graminicola M1.001]WDK13113.1 transmembrane amino acid transporter [Colletotrichum graminicola]
MSDTTPSSSDERLRTAVIANHLPAGYGTSFDGVRTASNADLTRQNSNSNSTSNPAANGNRLDHVDVAAAAAAAAAAEREASSLLLPGGDIHRDLFKISAREQGVKRAQTFSHPIRTESGHESDLPASEMLLPQGFRRQFIMQKQGFTAANLPITRNFVEFLDFYGSFAGEDLADSDEEAIETDDDDDDEDAEESRRRRGGGDRGPADETRPLLGRRRSSRFARKAGDASTTKTFFTTLKAFIGTGIMFLPKAFKNGGILFSSLTMLFVAAVSMAAFHLLLQCRARYGGGYGDLGKEISGPRMRALILSSIALSQIGFVCTGLVFVADNWFSFLQAVTGGANPLGSTALIALQAVVIVPLAFIRNISKLGPAALLADVFIVVGVAYIWWYDISALATRGMDPTVRLFNPSSYTLTIGASIFTFEGIGLIIPIQASMKKPEHFEPLLAGVMLLITCVFTSVGALCYATFGDRTKIEIIDNYPQESRLVNAVQFMYALAVLVGNPVQLFPAMRILEGKIFGHRSGKKDLLTKWKKNAFRTALVTLCVAISVAGSANLDRFVALIGSFACVPLVYIYPPYLHYKAIAETKRQKACDIALMALGLVGMVYTTAITLATSFL